MKIPKHLRVLYAENNEDACFMVTTMLKFSDIDVTTARTVTEAWLLGQSEYFDLYLLESRFPDGNGLDLCNSLHKFSPNTPVLFYSGDAFETDVTSGMAAGAKDYLIKPYFGDLASTVLKTINLNKEFNLAISK